MRAPSPLPAPTARLAVVVPSVNGWTDLSECLRHLVAERSGTPLEVLIVDRVGPDVRERVATEFPDMTLLTCDPGTTIPAMRAVAFGAATAPFVAVIEDHVHVPAGWAERLLSAVGDGDRVVGGAIENHAASRLSDSAAFLCEYSHLLPPIPAGTVASLTGNNVIYPRRLLEQFREAVQPDRWEDHLHETMRRGGVELVCHPDIVVGHKKHFGVAEYAGQRYLYSRGYAAGRSNKWSMSRRLAYGAAALALPPVLFWRFASRIWPKRDFRGLLVRSTPLILIYVVAWALGETAGAWWGDGGALARVR